MKIIAQTEGGFLVDIPSDEIYNLIGFYWRGQEGAPQLKPGDKITVHAMFEQLNELKGREKSLEKVATQLEATAALLRVKDPVITALSQRLAEADRK